MDYINLTGYAAGFLVLVSLIPQIVKSWKTKSTNDLSLARYLIYFMGILLWLSYSFMIKSLPMIISNSAALVLASMILYLKIRYK